MNNDNFTKFIMVILGLGTVLVVMIVTAIVSTVKYGISVFRK